MQENASEEVVGIKNLEAEFDADLAKELAQAFLDDTSGILDKLRSALAICDQEALRSSAHMLKGCSRALQAHQCERASAQLEDNARDGNFDRAAESLPLVVVAYGEAEAFLRKYLES
ncbi:Hpt domain-containing protein [Candidatus Obscuribacterales bacterium]|nr:Hpt domain-containing protein [Candidatus Obscuribacterales bacterium]MBX3134619.1 Hpt domain-containing protein [Candidatus Obscuribacterales bacterium]MBX3149996.1 Hpt domain-containing protein [Candidatus Obscuribacterales bacterium]